MGIFNFKKINSETENLAIEEESVFKAQTEFEKDLEHIHLPDAIITNDLYVYNKLMRVWYAELSAKNRYDEKMIQKLRNDWLDYMDSLRDRSTYNYLANETEDKEKSDLHRNREIIASRKVFAIEGAFASMVGESAVAELKRIREMSGFAFTMDGELDPKRAKKGM